MLKLYGIFMEDFSLVRQVESESHEKRASWSCDILQKDVHWGYNKFVPYYVRLFSYLFLVEKFICK